MERVQLMSRIRHENPRRLDCRGRILEIGQRTLMMGILNVTPDSFSDGGRFNRLDRAVEHARLLVEEGADLIDIGGESTRPGATPVPLEEELERVIPVIEAVAAEVPVPVSIDTYKAETARRALQAGAHLVNDVWGLKKDPDMATVIAEAGCPVVLMHNRTQANYGDLLADLIEDLRESITLAHQAGIDDRQLLLDPGIGFAKSVEDNLKVMRHLDSVVSLGYPVVLGTSRKSMIFKTLNETPQRVLEGTAATVALGIAQGCHIVRVHDVKAMKNTARMTDAILQGTL